MRSNKKPPISRGLVWLVGEFGAWWEVVFRGFFIWVVCYEVAFAVLSVAVRAVTAAPTPAATCVAAIADHVTELIVVHRVLLSE